jgi:hypothetical protein
MRKGTDVVIHFTCSCGRQLTAHPEHAGQEGRCPGCGATVTIPGPVECGRPTPVADAAEIAAEVLPPRRSPAAPGEGEDDAAVTQEPAALPAATQEAEEAVPRPSYKLFRPAAVFWATFFGNFFGGAVILALNYRRLGNHAAARTTLLTAGGLLVAYATALALLAEGLTGAAWLANLATLLVMSAIARRLQGESYEAHIRRGGQQASTGAAIGIGLLCGLLTVGLIAGLAVAGDELLGGAGASPPDFGTRIDFGDQKELYYGKGVTDSEARGVAHVLREQGLFAGPGAKTVQVRKEGGRFVVAFVVRDGAWNDPAVVQGFSALGGAISRGPLDGRPVIVELCDQFLHSRKTIRPGLE